MEEQLYGVVVDAVSPPQLIVVWPGRTMVDQLAKHLNSLDMAPVKVVPVDSFYPAGYVSADESWFRALDAWKTTRNK